ncbi:MAG: hypothetical protein N3A54_06400, partial [Patescibacteria group bacterium]|nr:hypothetical protein [Patescibacteria group bacterium]
MLNNGLRIEIYPGARRLKVSRNSPPEIRSSPLFVCRITVSVKPFVLYVTDTLDTFVNPPIDRNSSMEYGLPRAPFNGHELMAVSYTHL